MNTAISPTAAGSKWKMILKPSTEIKSQQKLDSLKEDNIKHDDGDEDDDDDDEEEDDDDEDDDDNDDDEKSKDEGSDSGSDDKHVEMEIFTQEEIIQKMPIIFLLYEFYFVNQYWYYANIYHTVLGYLSIIRIILLILGNTTINKFY
jgi:ABC-type Zn2+ transport system substrate-binding protein/surface adhesin